MKNIKTSSDDFIKIYISKEQRLILNKISPKMWTRLRIDQPSALRAKDRAQNNRGLFLQKHLLIEKNVEEIAISYNMTCSCNDILHTQKEQIQFVLLSKKLYK